MKVLRIIGIFLLVVVVVLVILVRVGSSLAVSTNNSGLDDFHNGDMDAALSKFDLAVKMNPFLAVAYFNRAEVKLRKGDKAGAMADYAKSLELKPDDSTVYNNRGEAKYNDGDLEGAMTDLNKAIELAPNDAESYNNRALVKKDKGDAEGALADYDKAISLNPKLATAYSNRASLRDSKGNADGALSDYTQALALEPNDAIALNNRGLLEYGKKDFDAATADYAAAIKIDGKNGSFYFNRGLLEEKKHDWDAALTDFDSALKYKESAKFHGDRGWVRFVKGDSKGAVEDDDVAIAKSPDAPGLYLNRAYAHYAAGQSAEAAADFQKAIDLKSSDTLYPRFYLCLVRMEKPNDKAAAIADLAAQLAARTEDPKSWGMLVGQFISGQLPEADFLNAAQSTDPKADAARHCEAYCYTGLMHERSGDKAGAQPLYQKCVDTGIVDYSEYQIARARLGAK